MVYINGQIPACIKEIGNKIRYQVMESILGMMGELTMDTGLTIICTVKEYILGPMVESMREDISMIKSMDMEYTPILMADHTKDNGRKVSSMEKEDSLPHKELKEKVFGMKVKE